MTKDNDTKNRILDAAIDLFAQKGYRHCTTREIGAAAGIKHTSMYYFFESKEDLLNTILEEFRQNFAKYRTPIRTVLEAAKTEPLAEVFAMLYYTFGTPEGHKRMLKITRIVMALQYENKIAADLYHEVLIDDSIEYIETILNELHKMGKIAQANFHWISRIIYSFALYMLLENLAKRDNGLEAIEKEYRNGIKFLCESIYINIVPRPDDLDIR